MKVLAVEKEVTGIQPGQYHPFLKQEALKVWGLYKAEILREAYFTAENEAVLVLECDGTEHADKLLAELPLVKQGLIAFKLFELHPYDGWERLFG